MTEAEWRAGDEISLFALGSTLLRDRWRIIRWMFLGAVVAALSVISKPALYSASASFVPLGNDASSSGIMGLASRLGMALPASGTPLLSPAFYTDLLRSSVLLQEIARDTFVVKEMGGQHIAFVDLFEIEGATPVHREEAGVAQLMDIVAASVVNPMGIVKFSVATEWPSVSLAIVTALVDEVHEFNRRTQQEQAAAERRFVEQRLAVASAALREAEDRLERFLVANRQFASSPELTFQHDRLQRDVALQQQVFTSLTQSYEDVRIREVRDTPVITLIEPPSVPTSPEPRGRVRRVQLGLLLGGFVGVVVALASGMMDRRRKEGDTEVEEFMSALGEVKAEILGRVRSLGSWFGR